MDESVHNSGDEDTIDEHCALCAARANVDAALVRSGAERVTIVSSYVRTRIGPVALERSKAIVCLVGGGLFKGEGHSREEAIFNALESAGAKV